MIEFIRQWLTGVTCAALIAALADGIMPKGAVKQVGKLVCALILLCAVLRPVLRLNVQDFTVGIGTVMGDFQQQHTRLEQTSGAMLKTLIERESAAYIVDKAAQLGLTCQAQVTCVAGDGGTWLPQSAYVTGQLEREQRNKLTTAIHAELGIAPEYLTYAGGE